MKHIDVIGQKYGKLEVVGETQRVTNGRKRYFVECVCECGNRWVTEKSKVLRGVTRSCGCLQKQTQKTLGSRNKKSYGEAAFNETYAAYKKSANKRGYSFELTKEEFAEIVVKPCVYCGESLTQEKRKAHSNGAFKYTGIDRYDNAKGYVTGNCVPCCKVCNRIKATMSVQVLERKLDKILSRRDFWKQIL